MHKHYLAITLIAVVVVALVGGTFVIGDTPTEKRSRELDNMRENDLNSIKYFVENYTKSNGSLPESLDQVEMSSSTKRDPQTDEQYGYKVLQEDKFQLCATFAFSTYEPLESAQKRKMAPDNYYDYYAPQTPPYAHGENEQCFVFTVGISNDENGPDSETDCIAVWSNCSCSYKAIPAKEVKTPRADCARECPNIPTEVPDATLVNGECALTNY